MGHKVNPISFRKRKNLDFIYFFNTAKKSIDLNLQDLSIKKYIRRVCLHQDFIILNHKVFRNFNNVFIFIKVYYWNNYRNKFLRAKSKKKHIILWRYYSLKKLKNLSEHLKINIKTFFKLKNVLIFIFNKKSTKIKKKKKFNNIW